MRRTTVLSLAFGLCLAACHRDRAAAPAAIETAPEAPAAVADAAAPVSPALAVREGGALVRSPDGAALYVADEDHAVVRRVPLPIDEASPPRAFPLPGRPAQVLGVGERVLVTIRDPGLLLVLRDRGGDLTEEARVALPGDAWGIAVTADGARALVSSAWTHRVSLVDLEEKQVRWSVETAREPRGIALRADGSAAWVTHLVGTEITKIESLDAQTPVVKRVALPADPLRAPWGQQDRVGASLGYAAVLAADEGRLFVARHALGGVGWGSWFGTTTVDVLGTAADEPVASRRVAPGLGTARFSWNKPLGDRAGDFTETDPTPFVQPRAMVLRRSASTLLVASEGYDALVELDAHAVAPALSPLRTYALAGPERRVELFREQETRWGGTSHGARFPVSACGAPSGVALSADEDTAYVYCRSTDSLAVVPLEGYTVGAASRPYRREETYVVARLAADPLPEPAAAGRRAYYDALDPVTSGGLGCAGCHPDGRDDGFVWREIHAEDAPGATAAASRDRTQSPPFFVANWLTLAAQSHDAAGTLGHARQTPMLAGRVDAPGPYGWLAESADLVARIRAGFALHRWSPSPASIYDATTQKTRAVPIAAFLREGLVPPPSRGRAPNAEEDRGREIFLSDTAGCARCHDPANGYTNRAALALPGRRSPAGFEPEAMPSFKVPSLFYVGATAPYFHDGAAASLEELVEQNLDHMGMTSHLSSDERQALVAFLRTIEPEPVARSPRADETVPWKPLRTRALPPDERGPAPTATRELAEDALPSIDAEPWPEVASPEPSRVEWNAAPLVRLARSIGCKAKRAREWVRIECANGNQLLMAGGTRAGLTLSANPELDVKPTVVFPVRRGDRRVIQLGTSWKWMTPFAVLSEQWLDGDPHPLIAFDGVYSAGMAVLP
ncbi:Cytochrome c551 peroxidase [Minicystis rosea]|nr:Cytochrome c551 peroxidase [Minicystis rosea]